MYNTSTLTHPQLWQSSLKQKISIFRVKEIVTWKIKGVQLSKTPIMYSKDPNL